MTAFALITGVIFRAPVQKIGKTGRPFTSCTIKTSADDAGTGDFWSIICFSESGQIELLRLEIGDAVSVRGKMKLEIFEKDGQARISRTLFADAAIGLRPAPRTPKAKAAKAAPASQDQAKQSIIPPSGESSTDKAASSFYDDEIPF